MPPCHAVLRLPRLPRDGYGAAARGRMRQNLYWLYWAKSPGEPPRRQEILGYPTRSTSPACNFASTPHTMSDLSPQSFTLRFPFGATGSSSLSGFYLFLFSSQTSPTPPIKRSRAQSASSSSSSLVPPPACNVVSVTRSSSPFGPPSLSLPTVTALGLATISLLMACL
ncbi:uncharacterized protein LY79DRAFT_546536 [Colletotrichum navitas]|uniref:Uncharacterized protein n=1 Tax=Colletotrichum navitas TaxID=681940 RepID=A0AAD8V897_9PEZI|nr:uncharacterized protein LY79DRAFT_546536 [Colletotrichum navitas]KAK1595476.1 hypothetical protein LY79DRAFT_546536 [Colletotrichum navitas]